MNGNHWVCFYICATVQWLTMKHCLWRLPAGNQGISWENATDSVTAFPRDVIHLLTDLFFSHYSLFYIVFILVAVQCSYPHPVFCWPTSRWATLGQCLFLVLRLFLLSRCSIHSTVRLMLGGATFVHSHSLLVMQELLPCSLCHCSTLCLPATFYFSRCSFIALMLHGITIPSRDAVEYLWSHCSVHFDAITCWSIDVIGDAGTTIVCCCYICWCRCDSMEGISCTWYVWCYIVTIV